MPFSFIFFCRKWLGRTLQPEPLRGRNFRPRAALRPLMPLRAPPLNRWTPHNRVSTLGLRRRQVTVIYYLTLESIPAPKKLSLILIGIFWLRVLILPSCLTASGEKAKKSCSVCSYKFVVADPHPTCLKHNTTCFRQYEFIPEGCIHCSYLINKFREGEKKQQAVLLARIDAMQHKISYLAKSNPDRLPERVKNRFLAGDKNPFAPNMRHLDPGPLAPSPASVAPPLFLPYPPQSKPPEQNQMLSPPRLLRLA